MKAKDKQNLFTLVFAALGGLIGWIVVFFNMTITETTSEFVVNQNEWTTKLVDNFTANHVFYLAAAAVLLVGYFLIKKPNKKRR